MTTTPEWIPLFTKYFPDEQILNPTFAIFAEHCKLCDTHITGETERDHLARHKRELRTYRRTLKAKQVSERNKNLEKAREARANGS